MREKNGGYARKTSVRRRHRALSIIYRPSASLRVRFSRACGSVPGGEHDRRWAAASLTHLPPVFYQSRERVARRAAPGVARVGEHIEREAMTRECGMSQV